MSFDKKAMIAQINQNLSTPLEKSVETSQKQRKEPIPEKKTTAEKPLAPAASGKPSAFWIDDTDRQIFHELGMLLYTQGIKPSDSLILRAAIRLIPRDHRFFEQVTELRTLDGRKIRHRHIDS